MYIFYLYSIQNLGFNNDYGTMMLQMLNSSEHQN